MHSVEGKSYQGTTERDTVKGYSIRIYITVLCGNNLIPRKKNKETREESCLIKLMSVCGNRIKSYEKVRNKKKNKKNYLNMNVKM